MTTELAKWAYPWTVALVVCFGAGACIFSYVRERRQGFRDNTEFFLTARNSVGPVFIAWSFFASAMGSWALFSVPSYSYLAGWVGLMMYSLFSGLPVLMIATIGTRIRSHVPGVLSFSDYALRRFGWIGQFYISCIMLFNMGIGITAEYTAMGDYFDIILGTTRIPIVIIVGVISSIYTAYGGLYISIITDQVQAAIAVILILVMSIYVAVTFRADLPRPLPTELSGSNYNGLASIAVMPISLACASVFSEGLWQRCWASASNRTLVLGGLMGSIFITIAVFIFGFFGFLAIWSGLWQYDYTDEDSYNIVLFTLLNNKGPKVWLLTLVACLAVTMSTSNVDTYQNAIVDNISSIYLRKQNVLWTRLLVLALNVPCIVTSLQGYGIINLFLLANLITSTATLPVLSGLITTRWAHRVITPATMLFGCWLGFTSLVVYGRIQQPHWALQKGTPLSLSGALHIVFFEAYDWPPFILALGFSVVGMVLMAIAENLVRMSLCNRFPALQYSDTHVRAMREPAPLPKSLNLGVGDKLAGVDFPGKPIQSGPPSKDTFSSYADNPAKV